MKRMESHTRGCRQLQGCAGVLRCYTPRMPKMPRTLTLIEGKRSETERLFLQMQAAPEQFDEDTFDELFERFGNRLSFDKRIDLLVRRVERGPRAHCLEERALLEAMVGDLDEARRLRLRLEKRNALGLRAITSPAGQERGQAPRRERGT